jgi:hypothetical protein
MHSDTLDQGFHGRINRAAQSALAFIEAGLAIFPVWGALDGHCLCGDRSCPKPGKHPHGILAPKGVKSATTDITKISSWFAAGEIINYGVACTKVFVVDVDPRNEGSWRKLIKDRKRGDVHTWTVNTGGGGEHRYFIQPATPIAGGNNKLGHGIDVKSVGGYVVGPGSIHSSGKLYHWAPQCSPDEVGLAPAPQWLLDALDQQAKSPLRFSVIAGGVKEGERSDSAAVLAGKLLSAGLLHSQVLSIMCEWWNPKNKPPLDDAEVKVVVDSIWRRHMRRLGYVAR